MMTALVQVAAIVGFGSLLLMFLGQLAQSTGAASPTRRRTNDDRP